MGPVLVHLLRTASLFAVVLGVSRTLASLGFTARCSGRTSFQWES